MNKKLIYSLIAGTMFTLTSCDDFLDVQPASGFTPEYIFSSESEMKALMTRIYSSMTEDGLYGSNLASGLNTNTDVEMSSFKNNTVSTNGSDIGCFDSRPTWSVLNATWNNIYYAINYANDFLQAVQESPLFSDKVTGDTPSETQQMYGEVKTLRAMLYLDLIRTWGDVVFIIKPTEATDDFFSLGTTDRNVILEYLIDDLIAVEPMMKYAVDLDYGVERASREYCQSLIGQLALYRGGWTLRADKEDVTHVGYMERGDNFEHYYEIAITYLGKVIKESKHDLTQSFENLWVNECNWKTANNDDVMFAVPMLKSVTSRYGYNIGVTIAEGKKQAAILEAEADREARIRRAAGEAQAIKSVAEAKAKEITMVYDAIKSSEPDEKLVQIKSLEALEEIAKGDANKVFIPFEATSALSSLGAAKEILKDNKK